jgi:hypothetical protein
MNRETTPLRKLFSAFAAPDSNTAGVDAARFCQRLHQYVWAGREQQLRVPRATRRSV